MPITTTLDAAVPVIRLTGEIEMPVSYALIDEIKLLHGYYQFRTIDLHIDSLGGNADALHFLVHALASWRKGEGIAGAWIATEANGSGIIFTVQADGTLTGREMPAQLIQALTKGAQR